MHTLASRGILVGMGLREWLFGSGPDEGVEYTKEERPQPHFGHLAERDDLASELRQRRSAQMQQHAEEQRQSQMQQEPEEEPDEEVRK
ncbi:MAG: hypothetical protein G01um1014106_743, partial [Parcubacteria group bacterium Gr01-1014_106]